VYKELTMDIGEGPRPDQADGLFSPATPPCPSIAPQAKIPSALALLWQEFER
jgi:hypothetical protein